MHDGDRTEGRMPAYVEDAGARTERRALVARAEGILAKSLVETLPEESPEVLDRIGREDRRMAKEGLVELMDETGEIYYKHIAEVDRWDVADSSGRR